MRKLADLHDGKVLSTKYENSMSKLKWQCKKGHDWSATPANVMRGSWCPKCAVSKVADSKRATIGEMQELAKSRGGLCLSTVYINAATKIEWKCVNGHVWMAPPNNVKKGHWCPLCAGLQKHTIEDMRALVKKHGGRCLSPKYINANVKLRWQCDKGHIWATKPRNIKSGSWCPICARVRLRASKKKISRKTKN